jgi:deazaflavin-dependent oxidoreductase (nitroreductase family)
VSGPAAAQSVRGRLQQSLINPVVRLAWNLGIPIPGDALLETTGRRTHLPRRTPVCDGLEGETFWLIAQRGRDADWVRNIEANPRVRVKVTPADPEPGQPRPPSVHVDVEGAEHEPADNPRRSG